ncbi:porin [Methylobacterium sp. ID0610]|uniref:porin n=1 Tax=Methylobacterium carpenticola TaxID=3344827 RepID=UPI0036B7FEE2
MRRWKMVAAIGLWAAVPAPGQALDLDLPRVPVLCPAQGAGFARMSGTETCLRIGGRMRAEAGTRIAPARDATPSVGAEGRLAIDARTQTELGPARTYIRLRAGSGAP